MSTRSEYLKRCIVNGKIIESIKWYVSCFGIPLLKDTKDWEKDPVEYSIVTQLDGLYFVTTTEQGQFVLEKITDYKTDTPLFTFQDLVKVDSSWLPTITTPIETKIGVLIINALVLYPSVGKKIPYINETIKVSMIESMLFDRVRNDDQLTEKDISVKEMINCIDRLCFLTNLSTIINVAATAKAITPAPAMASTKAKLLKEYEGQLHDPVKVVELEQKLTAVDNEYLKDDIAAAKIFNKKSKMARKKLFMIFGETKDFVASDGHKVIIPSLSEGVSTDPEDLPYYMNDLRSGSYFRGASTALSGYTYKILQRSLSGLRISETPCDTTKGFKRVVEDSFAKKLVGRYIRSGSKWVLVKSIDEAKKLVGQVVEIRSTIYCTAPGNSVCYACVSENYKNSPSGITNIAANISSVLMGTFLKATHGTITEVAPIDIKDLCT